ncbi:glutamate racemase [Leucothrix arctica]|uniref:glutamate racemase n=1 Tax=Leucothrix arctica TaxID=1481894 RepID=UPI001304CED9|nr:aspartate/glutamate racemase family protein [Leucothrix arctica]
MATLSKLVARHANGCEFVLQGCPGFVEQIEVDLINTAETEVLVRGCIEPLLEGRMDTFVMGCTHYAFLVPKIRQIAGSEVSIVETQDAVAQQVSNRLREAELLAATAIGRLERIV